MNLNEVYDAFRRAHEAGDTKNAQILADYIKTLPAYQGQGQSQAQDMVQSQLQQPQEDDRVGYFEGLTGGTKRLLSDATTALQAPFITGEEAALRGITRGDQITERSGISLEKVKELYETEGFGAAAKETLAQIPAAFGEQTPFIGSIILGARLGLAVAGPYGAIAGSLLMPFLQASGGAMERKAQTQLARGEIVDIDEMNAYATGLGSAALERAALGFSGLSKFFGISLKSTTSRAVAEKLAKESVASSLARGGSKLIAAEVPTEMAQSVLERYYAGLSLTDEDAKKEYAEAAFGASLLSPLGMYSGVSTRGAAKRYIEAEEYLQKQDDDISIDAILGEEISDKDKKEVSSKIKSRKEVEDDRKNTQEEANNVENEIIGTDLDNANIDDTIIITAPDIRRGDKDDREGTTEAGDKPGTDRDSSGVPGKPEFKFDPNKPETFVGPPVGPTESGAGGVDDAAGGVDDSLKVFTAKNGAKYTVLQLKQKAAEFLETTSTAGLANSASFLGTVKAVKQNFGQEAADIFYAEGLRITDIKVKEKIARENAEKELENENKPATQEEIFTQKRKEKAAQERAKENLAKEKADAAQKKIDDEQRETAEEEDLLKKAEEASYETFIDSVKKRVEAMGDINRQQELPGIDTIQDFNVTLKNSVIQDFVDTYNTILQESGLSQAESYRINKLGTDKRLQEVISKYYVDNEITIAVEKEQEIYTSPNLDRLKEFQIRSGLTDYVIRKDLGYKKVKGEKEPVEKIVSYSLVPRKTLGINKKSTNEEIKEKAAAYMAEDTQRIGKEYGFVFNKAPTPELVDKFLEDTLDKTEYEIIKNKVQFKDIGNRFKKLTPFEKDFTEPEKEKNESARRVEEFEKNIQALEGYDEFINLVNKLGLDIETIPQFLKTGVVFGAKNSPIMEVNSIDELMDYVLADYVFEESADATHLGNAFEFAGFKKEDMDRRADLRKEFYDSPLLDAYLKRNNISKKKQKNVEPEYDLSLDILVEIQKAMHKSANEFYYNNRRTKEQRDNSQELTNQQLKGIARSQVERLRDIKLLEILRTEGVKAAREFATKINNITNREKAKQIRKEATDKRKNKKRILAKDKTKRYKTMDKEVNEIYGGKYPQASADHHEDILKENLKLAESEDHQWELEMQELEQQEQRYKTEVYDRDEREERGTEEGAWIQITDEKMDIERERDLQGAETLASRIIEDAGNIQDAIKGLLDLQDKRIQKVQNNKDISEETREAVLNILEFEKQLLRSLLTVEGLQEIPVFMVSQQVLEEQQEKKDIGGFYQTTEDGKDNAVFLLNIFSSKTTIKNFLHEAVHVATVFGLDPKNITEAERENWSKIFNRAKEVADKKGLEFYGLESLEEFIAEAFTNRKFQNFLQDIDSVLDKQPTNKFVSLFDDLIATIGRMLGGNLDNSLLGDTIESSGRLFSFGPEPIPGSPRAKNLESQRNYVRTQNKLDEGFSKSEVDRVIPPSTRTKPGVKNFNIKLVDEAEESNRVKGIHESHERRTRTFPRRIGDFFNSWLFDGQNSIDKVVTAFENKSYAVKKFQDALEYSKLLISGEKGFNNVFTQLTTVFGKADNYMRNLMIPLQDYEMSLRDFEKLYVKQNSGATQADARTYLQDILTGLHENERRQVKYMLQVPLSIEKTIQLGNGKLTSPADYRNSVMKIITTKNYTDPNQRATDLKLYREQLLNLTDPNTVISGKPTVDTENGVGYRKSKADKKLSNNIANPEYDVTSLGYDKAQELRNDYELLETQNPELHSSINTFIKNMQVVQEKTKTINTIGRYAPPQALNVMDFYGWENYIPIKGRADIKNVSESTARLLDPAGTSQRMSRDLKKLEPSFEGTQADAEEPFTQIIVDASMAAARAGRITYTESIYNALTTEFKYTDKQGNQKTSTPMDGKVEKTFTYEERYTNDPRIEEELGKPNTIVHFLEDGSLVIMSIKDDDLLLAIRNSYDDKNPLVDIMNTVTGTIGQLHTRFNPKFAPLNFVRDAITAEWIIGTDMGVEDVAGFTQDLAAQVFNGGMRDTWKIISFHVRGKMDERDVYAKKRTKEGDGWAQDMVDYLDEGGMVAYQQALSNQTAFEKSQQDIGATPYLKTKKEIVQFFDTWQGNFELATRVAAYRTKKRNYLAQKAPGNPNVPADIEKGAREEAAAYAKRLSNFEEMGTMGRTLGGLYIFFRPSAVGATRALESIGPAFRDFSLIEERQADYIKDSPENLKTYRESLAKKKESAQATIVTGLGFGMAMFYMAAALSEGEGEENKTLDDDLARWTRYARFDISGLTGTKNQVIQIPWGFGIGGIPAIGAQIAGLISSRENPPINIIGNIVNIGLDSFAPLPISRMDPLENTPMWFFDSIVPSSVRPIFEYIVNKNAFGSPIYTSQARSRYGTVNQGKDNTPDMYKDLALAVANATGGEFTIDPNKLYFFSNNYIDGIATTAQNLYSLNLSAQGKKEFNIKSDTILFGSFISKYSELDQRAYNRVRLQIENLDRKMNLFEGVDAPRYMDMVAKYPGAEAAIANYNILNAQLNKINEQAKFIRKNPNYDRKTKEALIKDIKEQQLIYKRQITTLMDMALGN